MELNYPQQQAIDADEPIAIAEHLRSVGYTGEDEEFPSPSFAGFISALAIMIVFALVLSFASPLLSLLWGLVSS